MGVILGWPYILVAFFISYTSGAIISLLLIALKSMPVRSFASSPGFAIVAEHAINCGSEP